MKKILLCSIALLALAMVIACKAGEDKENKKLNDNESVQDERSEDNDAQDKETNDTDDTDDTVKDTDDNANSSDVPDTDSNDQKEGDEEQKGHPPNSYKDIDYDVKSIHE